MFGSHCSAITLPPGKPFINFGGCFSDGTGGFFSTLIWTGVDKGYFPGDRITVYTSTDGINYTVFAGPLQPTGLPYIAANIPVASTPVYAKAIVTRNSITSSFSDVVVKLSCP